MEILLIVLGVILVIGCVQECVAVIEWGRFFKFLIFGGVSLAVLFSFTAEGVIVIVGAYLVLLVISVIYGGFRKAMED
jgi:hypothetical protein